VHHPYSDQPVQGIFAHCYAFEEAIAEKIRALAQRARPRDLYDVIHFFRNRNSFKNKPLMIDVLQKKCAYKNIEVPTFKYIQEHEKLEELNSEWKNMLAHQLPPIETFWSDLQPFFEWLENRLIEKNDFLTLEKGETVFYANRFEDTYSLYPTVYKIQYAAANRLCIKLEHKNQYRTVEPIAFRRSKEGYDLLCGFERDTHQLVKYILSDIESVTITNLSYSEKYFVEINTMNPAS
jgi:hypothetical protein